MNTFCKVCGKSISMKHALYVLWWDPVPGLREPVCRKCGNWAQAILEGR